MTGGVSGGVGLVNSGRIKKGAFLLTRVLFSFLRLCFLHSYLLSAEHHSLSPW